MRGNIGRPARFALRIGHQPLTRGRFGQDALFLFFGSEQFDRLWAQHHLHRKHTGEGRAGLGDFFDHQTDRGHINPRPAVFGRDKEPVKSEFGRLCQQFRRGFFVPVDLVGKRLHFLSGKGFGHVAQRALFVGQPVKHWYPLPFFVRYCVRGTPPHEWRCHRTAP